MTTITAYQHFFSSVPRELTGSRGGQTFARSAEVAPFQNGVEASCYFLLEDLSDASTGANSTPPSPSEFPVNWGWYSLGGGYLCVQRVGDAGVDDIGRPGNFLCHNLVFREQDLEAIDFDIPCLLEWVSQQSPIRYQRVDGDDGFARRFLQVCRTLGIEYVKKQVFTDAQRQALNLVPPLQIPLADLIRLRERRDGEWRARWDDVIPSTSENSVASLLKALLAPSEATRPVVVTGLGLGAGESSRERAIVELLYALLPYHCRRKLTFATYAHAEYFDPRKQTAHSVRALCMVNKYSDPKRLSESRDRVYLLDAAAARCDPDPPDTEGFRRLWRLATRGSGAESIRLRRFAGSFAFPAAASGLEAASRLLSASENPTADERTEAAFREASACQRRYAPELWPAAEAVSAWKQSSASPLSTDDWIRHAEMMLAFLVKQTELMPAGEAPPGESASRILTGLFGCGLDRYFAETARPASAGAVDVRTSLVPALRNVLAAGSESPLLHGDRLPLFDAFADVAVAKCAGKRARQLVALWMGLETALPEGSEPAERFLGRLSVVVAQALLRAGTAGLEGLTLDRTILPLLSSFQIDTSSADQLNLVFQLLGQATAALPQDERDESMRRCLGDFAGRGCLTPALLATALRTVPDTVIRHYPQWLIAAEFVPALDSTLHNAGLLKILWKSDLRKHDRDFHIGYREALRRIRAAERTPASASTRDFLQEYASSAPPPPAVSLVPPATATDLWAEEVVTQAQLVESIPSLCQGPPDESLRKSLDAHLRSLLASVGIPAWPDALAEHRRSAATAVLRCLQQQARGIARRAELFLPLSLLWIDRAGEFSLKNLSPEIEQHLSGDELRWHALVGDITFQKRESLALPQDLTRLLCSFLLRHPESCPAIDGALGGETSSFLAWLRDEGRALAPQALRRELVGRFKFDLDQGNIVDTVRRWAADDSLRCRYLLPYLNVPTHAKSQETWLDDISKALATRLDNSDDASLEAVALVLGSRSLPDAVRNEVGATFAHSLFPRLVNQWIGLIQDGIRDDNKRAVLARGQWACRLAEFAGQNADVLAASGDVELLRNYLKFLGFILPRMKPGASRLVFPHLVPIVRLALRDIPTGDVTSPGVHGWKYLLSVANSECNAYLDDCMPIGRLFVLAGESLVMQGQSLDDLKTIYRNVKDDWFRPPPGAIDVSDMLIESLRIAPAEAEGADASDSARRTAIVPRARLAEALCGTGDMLGRICYGLGSIRVTRAPMASVTRAKRGAPPPVLSQETSWSPHNTAMALAALVVAEGTGPDAVASRTRDLLRFRFAAGLRQSDAFSQSAEYLCDILRAYLEFLGVPQATAEEAASRFRTRLRSWWHVPKDRFGNWVCSFWDGSGSKEPAPRPYMSERER